jgi:hypothetical protein
MSNIRTYTAALRSAELRQLLNTPKTELFVATTSRQTRNGTIAVGGIVGGVPVKAAVTATGAVLVNGSVRSQVLETSALRMYKAGLREVQRLLNKRAA